MPIELPRGYQGTIEPQESLRSPQAFLVYHEMMSTNDLTAEQVDVLKTIIQVWTKDHADMVNKRVRLDQNLSRLSRAIAPLWLSYKMIPGSTLDKLVEQVTVMMVKDLGIPDGFVPTIEEIIVATKKILQAPQDKAQEAKS